MGTTGCAPIDAKGTVEELIPSVLGTDPVSEVIAVASTGAKPASFSWRFGKPVPVLTIVEPTELRPIYVGHPASPHGARPFLVKLRLVDEQDQPIAGLVPSEVIVRLPGCFGPKQPACQLAHGTDYTVASLSAGQYWVKVHRIPADMFGAWGNLFDLQVEVAPAGASLATATERYSLMGTLSVPKFATQLVIDSSGSMGDPDGSKLEAAKIAGTLIVEGMPDEDDAGIVTFADNADSPLVGVPGGMFGILPLAQQGNRQKVLNAMGLIFANSWTSIGDGLLEAQSNFDKAYGPTPTPLNPFVENIVLLSDGVNYVDWHPVYYYQAEPGAPHDDGDGDAPWVTHALSLPARKAQGYILPIVSAIALGQDADQGELMAIAQAGGGTFTYIDGPVSGGQLMSTTIDMADTFRMVMTQATGLQRAIGLRAPSLSPADMSDLSVESGSSELLVSVAADSEALPVLRLAAPGGTLVDAVQRSDKTAVFRVVAPEPGRWSFRLASGTTEAFGTEPRVFVEHAVRSPIVLFGGADVEAPAPIKAANGPSYESQRWTGRDVLIRAVPTDGGDILGASVTAEVRAPAGTVLGDPATLVLLDDGAHGDGRQGDGIYGAIFRNTTAKGAYAVKLVAVGHSTRFGTDFRREIAFAFELHPGQDTDEDGLPDWWERENGTDPLAADSDADPDQDGLANAREFGLHTSAEQADTDQGGESDASEAAHGRDPLDPRDDTVKTPWLDVFPGTGRVVARPTRVATRVSRVQIQGATGAAAGFVTLYDGPAPEAGIAYLAAPNDTESCYRMRLVQGSVQSGWSAPRCAVPRVDPLPPVVKLSLESGMSWTRTRAVAVRIDASDEPRALHLPAGALDPQSAASGVADMMVATRSDFAGAAWRPAESPLNVWLPDAPTAAIWVKVRDKAGNESSPASVVVRVAAATPVDAAIGLEERAVDAIRAHAFSSARDSIGQSFPKIDQSIGTVLQRIASGGQKPDPEDVRMLVDLALVRAFKTKAHALAKPVTAALAEKALLEALERERAVADRAYRAQKGL
jgi:hypothetical protein